MTTYITQDGTKITANSTLELCQHLQLLIPSLNLEQSTISLDHAIAQLIKTDYLRVVDTIDG